MGWVSWDDEESAAVSELTVVPDDDVEGEEPDTVADELGVEPPDLSVLAESAAAESATAAESLVLGVPVEDPGAVLAPSMLDANFGDMSEARVASVRAELAGMFGEDLFRD